MFETIHCSVLKDGHTLATYAAGPPLCLGEGGIELVISVFFAPLPGAPGVAHYATAWIAEAGKGTTHSCVTATYASGRRADW